jgi:hypothetical protein
MDFENYFCTYVEFLLALMVSNDIICSNAGGVRRDENVSN